MNALTLVQTTLFKSALQNWLQVLFTIIAIVVGSAGLSAVLILNNAAQSEYSSMNNNPLGLPYAISAIVKAKNPDKAPLTQSDYSRLRRMGFSNIVALSQTETALADGTEVDIIGVDAPALAYFANRNGDPLGLTEGILVSDDLIPQVAPNQLTSLELKGQLSLPDLPVRKVASQSSGGNSSIVMDLYYFAEFIERDPHSKVPKLILELAVIGQNEPHTETLREIIPAHLQVKTVSQPVDPAAITQSLHLNLLAMSIVMFVVCFFIVVNALNLLLLGRAQLFKTLRQLGVHRTILIVAQIIELSIYATLGAGVGVFIGHFLAVSLAPTLALTLAGLFNINLGFMQLNSIHLALPMILICIIATLLAAVLPYKQLNIALSQKVFSHTSGSLGSKKLFGFFVSILVVTALGIFWGPETLSELKLKSLFESSLTMTFITIGTLIITGIVGLFWIYPTIIQRLTLSSENRHPMWHWSFAHSLILANKTKLASAAFMIALVTHIGMNLMVGSFREATNDWLEQRLVGDFYAYGDNDAIREAKLSLLKADIHHFARFQIDTQVSIENTGRIKSQTAKVYSYPYTKDYQQALLVDQMSLDAWSTYQSLDATFVNQQFAFRNGVKLNDSISIAINGETRKLKIKAIYMDYGNPFNQILVPPEMFNGSAEMRVMAIHLDDRKLVSRKHLDTLLPPTITLYSRDEILGVSMQAFDKTFLITDALNIVTLLVAVFSLTTSIILLEQKNRYVSALIRSFGVSKLNFTLALFAQYALLCLIAAIWAIPFGIIFAWLLVTRLNVYAFQWQFPFVVQPAPILIAVCLSLAVVLALTAIPIFRRQQSSIREQLSCRE